MAAMVYLGYWVSNGSNSSAESEVLVAWQDDLHTQRQELENIQQQSTDQLDALAVRLAQLQARLVRLEALGERLTGVARLDRGEFDFSQPPAVGGPEEEAAEDVHREPPFVDVMDRLERLIDDREQQLNILETLIVNRQIEDAGYLAGRPIKKGWMSSRFGRRTDPFHGKMAWHNGVDFAGTEDADIIAVASGVVTWSAERYGYGQMVEINHGNSYTTRYAHNKNNLVSIGEVVKKGQVIAKMGSSGRSTGPHVHFEVYRNGKVVNPTRYINRTDR